MLSIHWFLLLKCKQALLFFPLFVIKYGAYCFWTAQKTSLRIWKEMWLAFFLTSLTWCLIKKHFKFDSGHGASGTGKGSPHQSLGLSSAGEDGSQTTQLLVKLHLRLPKYLCIILCSVSIRLAAIICYHTPWTVAVGVQTCDLLQKTISGQVASLKTLYFTTLCYLVPRNSRHDLFSCRWHCLTADLFIYLFIY